MNHPAKLENDCSEPASAPDLSTQYGLSVPVNLEPLSARASDPLDLDIDLTYLSRYKVSEDPEVPQSQQKQGHPIAVSVPVRLPRSLFSSVPGHVQSSSSGVCQDTPEMGDPRSPELQQSQKWNESFEDWCKRAELEQLEDDQLRRHAASKTRYDPRIDPELSMLIEDSKEEAGSTEKMGVSPESSAASGRRHDRRFAKHTRVALACNACRNRKVKVKYYE